MMLEHDKNRIDIGKKATKGGPRKASKQEDPSGQLLKDLS